MEFSLDKPGTPEELVLQHHGVKGMHWGIQKENITSTNSVHTIKGLDQFTPTHAKSIKTVSKKMNSAYGFKIDEMIPLSKKEEKRGYIAYVGAITKGKNVIHMDTNPKLKNTLDNLEKKGWLVNSNGHSIESNLTHESAHALFHTSSTSAWGFKVSPSRIDHMRESAWNKAKIQALKDGDVEKHTGLKKLIKPSLDTQLASKISKYAESALFIEEAEAEIFSSYHWGSNPPKFVDTFMNDIHKNLGKEVKPFSGRKMHA